MSVITLTDYLADSDCPELCDNDGFTLIDDYIEEVEDWDHYMNLVFN